MIRSAACLTLCVAVSGLAACSSSSNQGTSSPPASSNTAQVAGSNHAKISKVTFVELVPSYPGFEKTASCMAQEGKKYGISVTQEGPPSINAQEMSSEIDQAVAQGTQAIVTTPPDATSLAAALQRARAKGVLVGTMLGGDNNADQRQFDVGTDLEKLGRVMMDGIGAKDPNAHVMVVWQSPDQTVQVEVLKGFWAEAAAKFPNIKKVTDVYDNGDATTTVGLVDSALTAHPDTTAIYDLDGATVQATATAIQQSGKRGKILYVVNDAVPATRALIENGVVYGAGIQLWCTEGQLVIDNFVKLAAGQAVPASTPTAAFFVTKDTLSQAIQQD